jgi:putative addiction module component (TIGR02574 family)
MSAIMADVLELATVLSDDERHQVAEALLSGRGPTAAPFDPAWVEEAKRRAARIDAGEGKVSTWEEVRDRARAALRRGDSA